MMEFIGQSQTALKREFLHVQSISCWAAACIGPYSQSHQGHVHIYHSNLQ